MAGFALLTTLVAVAHEPWRDEFQALLIGRAASDLGNVVYLARYEGHPSLWYMLLHLLGGPPWDVTFAKVLGLVFIHAAAALILFRSPFRTHERILIVAGYFFVYEYAAFFRNYGIATMLILATVACMTSPSPTFRRSTWVPLVILPFTQIYGLIAGMGLIAAWVVQHLQRRSTLNNGAFIALILVPLSASFLAIQDLIPPDDGQFYGEWKLDMASFLTAAEIPLNAMVPIAPLRMEAWNVLLIRDLFQALGSAWPYVILSIAVWSIALLPLRRSKAALALFVIASLGIVAFAGLRYHGFLRHHGMLFIAYLAAHWLMRSEQADHDPPPGKLWRLILVAQVVAAVQLVVLELRHPFSGANSVAKALREQGLEEVPIVAAAEHCAISVAGALDRPVFYPSVGAFATYINWDNTRHWGISQEEHLDLFLAMASEPAGALLLTEVPLDALIIERYGLLEIHRSRPTIQPEERFAVYMLQNNTPPTNNRRP